MGDSASSARAYTRGYVGNRYSRLTLWDTDAFVSAACQNRAAESRRAVAIGIAGLCIARYTRAAESAIWAGVTHAIGIVRIAIKRVLAAHLTLALSGVGACSPGG